jgi:hypothetical protein
LGQRRPRRKLGMRYAHSAAGLCRAVRLNVSSLRDQSDRFFIYSEKPIAACVEWSDLRCQQF